MKQVTTRLVFWEDFGHAGVGGLVHTASPFCCLQHFQENCNTEKELDNDNDDNNCHCKNRKGLNHLPPGVARSGVIPERGERQRDPRSR